MAAAVDSWDLFISHASEDKSDFVKPLASALSAFGVKVWYDEYALNIGDSLSRSIDKGLGNSQYGLVVLSPAFIAKKWPEYELRGLVARELSADKIILPIWHKITHQEVLKFSPPLADKMAVRSDQLTPPQIAIKIIEAIRPDIFTRILQRVAHYGAIDSSETTKLDPRTLRSSPIRHERLPPDLVSRIRLVRASLLGVHSHSMANWLDGFKRDAHPSKEVAYWERVAAVYQEYLAMTHNLTVQQHKDVFNLIFFLGLGDCGSEIEKLSAGLPEGALDVLLRLYAHDEPVYDFDEPSPFNDEEEPSEATRKWFEQFDKEHFPNDLPEDLIRKIMGTTK